nr:exopolysaccharide Pel transporter PelG [Lachnospiraceae bacterium]
MAGIGVKLDKIYEKNTLITTLSGMSYSTIVTIAPMIIVMVSIYIMMQILGFGELEYADRELFSCTILYIFIFALIATSILNAVISRYIADVIFDEHYDAVMPCFYFCLFLTLIFGLVPAVPFFIHEYMVGQVDPIFIFLSFVGYVALIFVFYSMLYLNICKEYERTTLFYLIAMVVGVGSSWLLDSIMEWDVIYSMMTGVDIALTLLCILEYAQLLKFFPGNDHNYTRVVGHFKTYWSLIVSNTLYIFGLYIHNFIFWTTDLQV